MVPRYAVFDVETTGLYANYHRVLAVAVVLVDDHGRARHEWSTLVNPERRVTATEIHGITDADVRTAPKFPQIAAKLRELLAGRVPVAHNLAFDAGFLCAEFRRIGVDAPLSGSNGLCTMRMAGRYLQVDSHSLQACCACIGHRIPKAHTALADAQAAAKLLAHYMQADADFQQAWGHVINAAIKRSWPEIPLPLAT